MITNKSILPNRIETLAGLRFFAAAAIVMHHLPGVLWLPPNLYGPIPMNQAVSIFFVLSGFVLQHAYRDRLDRITNFKFLALRFWRLWPCHVAVIALLVILEGRWVVIWFVSNYTPAQILSAAFLFQAWSPDTKGLWALNGPSWAISVEMFFYAMFPFLSRQAAAAPWRPAIIGAIITSIWFCSLWLYKPTADIMVLSVCNPLARIFEFAIGISAYEAVIRYRKAIGNTFAEVVSVLLVMLCVIVLSPAAATFLGIHGYVSLSWWMISSFSFWAFLAVIVIFFHGRGRISRFVASAPVVYLGELSFALYLVHQPLISYFSRAQWFSFLPLAVQVITFVIVILTISSALHHFVEKPCTFLAKKLIL